MTRTLQSVVLFLLVCVFSTAGAQTAQVSPQQNISLTWVHGMYPVICFVPPLEKSVPNSKYKIHMSVSENMVIEDVDINSKEYCTTTKRTMNGGRVKFTVTTPEEKGKTLAVISYMNPVLVKHWECVFTSASTAQCSWKPTPDAPRDLRFFYILRCASCNGTDKPFIQECPSYIVTHKIRTGCNLMMKTYESINILFNGTTVNNETVRNTYQNTSLNVKLPALDWTVNKTEKEFNVSWIIPDVYEPSDWTITIKYTECDRPVRRDVTLGKTYEIINRESSCPYRISIGAEVSVGRGRTEWSREKTFNADFNLSLFAAIIIPLVLVIVVILTLVFCRQNKENIFPKVPVPRDLLSDISENNNKITVGNLYSPGKEEEDCKITLVIDPQINKLDTDTSMW